uniref:Uncharacterized protein n=1 Tax=Romanomermis culicivorax TaxID=13658 RepID=A0A915IHG9_ROMCU
IRQKETKDKVAEPYNEHKTNKTGTFKDLGNASDETGQFLPTSLSDNKNHQKRIEMRQHSTVLTIMFSYLVSSLPWSIAQLWLIYPHLYVDGFATIVPWLHIGQQMIAIGFGLAPGFRIIPGHVRCL